MLKIFGIVVFGVGVLLLGLVVLGLVFGVTTFIRGVFGLEFFLVQFSISDRV